MGLGLGLSRLFLIRVFGGLLCACLPKRVRQPPQLRSFAIIFLHTLVSTEQLHQMASDKNRPKRQLNPSTAISKRDH
jgi:hypothetical protein